MKRLDEIFNITYGSQLDLNKCETCEKPDGFNFVNRSSENCGVSSRILEVPRKRPFPAGCITSAMGGTVLASFVQQEDFYTGQNVKVLMPKQEMSLAVKLFYCSCIEANRFRFSTFGREANASFDSLLVPDLDKVPKRIRDMVVKSPLAKAAASPTHLALDIARWRYYTLGKLFRIEKGKRLTKANMIPGSIRYIGAIDSNNGVSAHISNNEHLHPANTISVSYNGSIAEAFYQDMPYWATDDVNVLYPRFSMNRHIAIFLCAVIGNEKYRFSYGRKWDKDLMIVSKILLPSKTDEEPNWEWMENYIKGLPYSAAL